MPGGNWAENAETAIPIPPVPGTAYRNPTVDLAEWQRGWPYTKKVDSSKWNQLLYLLTSIVREIEQTGILTWSDQTNFLKDAMTMGTDGVLYHATAPSGPGVATGAQQPPNATYWKKAIPPDLTAELTAHNTSSTAHADMRALMLSFLDGLPSYDDQTHIITFTRHDGAALEIDLPLEGLAQGLSYDSSTKELVLTALDGGKIRVSVADLIDVYTGFVGDHVQIAIGEGNIIRATLLDGKIGKEKLTSALQAQIDGGGVPSGPAGGDLTGTYPNPTLAGVTQNNTTSTANPGYGATFTAIDGVTRDTKGRVTGVNTKTVTMPAAQTIPTSLPPSGNAGGDLGGSYPNPTVPQISQDIWNTNQINAIPITQGAGKTKVFSIADSYTDPILGASMYGTGIALSNPSGASFNASRGGQLLCLHYRNSINVNEIWFRTINTGGTWNQWIKLNATLAELGGNVSSLFSNNNTTPEYVAVFNTNYALPGYITVGNFATRLGVPAAANAAPPVLGTATGLVPGTSSVTGSLTNFARQDHNHGFPSLAGLLAALPNI